jgi:hypothetical protein
MDPFQFGAGPYRFVRESYRYATLGEYLLTVEASGVVDARHRKSYMEVRS